MKKNLLLSLILLISTYSLTAQVSADQEDDFEDDTAQNWKTGGANFVTVETTGGPDGAGDAFVQYISTGTGGAASRMAIYNENNQWAGNFTSEGIVAIRFDVNVTTNDLNLRIAMQDGPFGNRIATTNAVPVTAGSGWTRVIIPISASDFTVAEGVETAANILQNVFTVRIISSASPVWRGDVVAATIQVDNVKAATTLGTDEISVSNEFTLAPNPGSSEFNLSLSKITSDAKIEVFDILGKRIVAQNITQINTTINVSNWNSGVYLVRVFNNDTVVTKRFVKQ